MFNSEDILASIHRAAPCAIGVVVDRTFRAVNAQMCKMSGYREDELIGQSARMVYPNQSEFERVGKEKYSMMEKKRVGTIETQWQTKDGRLIDILLSSTPMDGINLRNGVTFTATDITIQKDSEREKARIISSLGRIVADRTRWLNENNQGLESTINIVWNEIKYKSELIRDFHKLPPVLCYSQQINQVFMNLLINAAQSIEKDGLIQVSTRHENGQVAVNISDNGAGIPVEIQSQIFDPFFTTKEIGKGTGLGLSMAYSIVEKHGGRIAFHSTPGKGTTFSIYLPAAQ